MFEIASQNSRPKRRERSNFPVGLRVLVVDGDVISLNNVRNMLRKCSYGATTTTKAREALEMLRNNKDDYDVVLCDVRMPDMDSFKLLEIIVLIIDIPVIMMMSVNDEMSSAMKCIRHGAQYCLLKPIQLSELKNIWQHVLRKNMLDSSKLDLSEVGETKDNLPLERENDNNRGNVEGEEAIHHPDRDSYQCKKRRFSWTEDLKTKFINVVQELGINNATPKVVLENMNEEGLTREIIASHLQKYRNSLKKQDNGKLKRDKHDYSQGLQRELLNKTSVLPLYNNYHPSFYPYHQSLSAQQNVQTQETANPIRSVRSNLAEIASHPWIDVRSQTFHLRRRMHVDYPIDLGQFGNVSQPGPTARGLVAENTSQVGFPTRGISSQFDPLPGSLNYGGIQVLEGGSSFNHHSETRVLKDYSSQPFQPRQPDSTSCTSQSSLSGSQCIDFSEQNGQLIHSHLPSEIICLHNDPNPSEDLKDTLQ